MDKIDIINAEFPRQCLNLICNVYQDKNTNQHTQHYLRFELQKIFGTEYDVIGFLKSSD